MNEPGDSLRIGQTELHYADCSTSPAAPSSGNDTAGHITQPST
jgi:hypothetical protein